MNKTSPGKNFYSEQLKKCREIEQASKLHNQMLQNGINLEQDRFLANLTLDMYGTCGYTDCARKVFTAIADKNSFSWTLMLRAYARNGRDKHCVHLFFQMLLEGVRPDAYFLSIVIGVCSLEQGRRIHKDVINGGGCSNSVVENSLMSMYVRCGDIGTARELFKSMRERNSVSWNTIITANTRNGDSSRAIILFHEMLQEGVEPTESTYVGVLSACSMSFDIERGKIIHKQVIETSGFDSSVLVANSLVNMYGKCNQVCEARRLFDSMNTRIVSTWNSMISAYARNGQGREAIELFEQMDIEPDEVTFLGLFSASMDSEQGRKLHKRAADMGLDRNVLLGNLLISFYGKLDGGLEDAKCVFYKIHEKNAGSWNALIAAYAHEHPREALALFHKVDLEGIKADLNTLTSALDACTQLETVVEGENLHRRCKDMNMMDETLGTALINFYGKFTRVTKAREIFETLSTSRDIVVWNAMLVAYARSGNINEVLGIFYRICLEGIRYDDTTFVSLLNACSHFGLFSDGHQYFAWISTDYGLSPTAEHYRCLIDLLGRAGQLEKAEEVIQNMPYGLNYISWMTLLGASKLQENTEYAHWAAEQMLKLESRDSALYTLLLSNMQVL